MYSTSFLGFFLLAAFSFVHLNGQEVKQDLYYLSTTIKNEETGKNEPLYLRALLPKENKKTNDVIIDDYYAYPSSQWEIKRKPDSRYFTIVPKANRNNILAIWGGGQNEPKKGFAFEPIEDSEDTYLIRRINPKAKAFYMKHNGKLSTVTIDSDTPAEEMTQPGSPFIWKLTVVQRTRTTAAP